MKLRRPANYRRLRGWSIIASSALVLPMQELSGQTSTDEIVDATYCAPSAPFVYKATSGRWYRGFATRGADAPAGKVFYAFSVTHTTGNWVLSGNFWVYAYECRISSFGIGTFSNIPPERWGVVETPVGWGGGGGCNENDEDYSYYDPGTDLNGPSDCSGGGGSGDGGSSSNPTDDQPILHCYGDIVVVETVDPGSGSVSTVYDVSNAVCEWL